MGRFCAALASREADREVALMGGIAAFSAPPCAFGLLPAERPGADAGPWRAGGLVAVGEATIYNGPALRTLLEQAGWPAPATCSDGELLLQLYARRGLSGLAQVSGMFVMAIWDGNRLTLVRDPVGTRTLFYARSGTGWGAASTLRALRRWPSLPTKLNLAAVRSFLTFAYLPGAETLLAGVDELLPGHAVRLAPDGAATLLHYWEPREGELEPAAAPATYAAGLRELLTGVTVAMLPAGEPVGAFLSGGIDSSLVTALAAQLHDQPVQSYSINFGTDLPNELAYAGLVAAHCRTRHRVLTFSGRQIAAGLAEATALLDCPVGDPLTVPNMLLARAAAADGLKVVLNGEGGDPCFGGPKNLPMLISELHRTDSDPHARATSYLHSYRKCYSELERLLTPDVQRALAGAPPLERLVQPYLETPGMRSFLNRLTLTNVRTKGAHHILTKVERLTAAAGISGRSPLFDPAVVNAAFAIPPALRLRGTNEKWILKQAVADLLPSTIIERPKSGMRVPVQSWLGGPLRNLAVDLLLGKAARSRGLFQPATISAWLAGEGSIWPRQGSMVWILLTLELWLRAYLDRAELDPSYFATRRRFFRGWL